MAIYKLLSIDETGKASYTHPSDIYILAGVVIPETLKPKINSKMNKIKKKYFGDENVVFHSRSMARKLWPFVSLKDAKKEHDFWMEFVSVVNRPEISVFSIITNKQKAKKASWVLKTILERSYLRLLSEFAKHLKVSSACGKIINESEAEQDKFLIYAHNRLQNMGTGDGSVSGKEYKNMVTSLCLVNKANHDIDVQIADILAYVAKEKYCLEILKKNIKLSQIEKMKLKVLERKLSNQGNPSLFEVLI